MYSYLTSSYDNNLCSDWLKSELNTRHEEYFFEVDLDEEEDCEGDACDETKVAVMNEVELDEIVGERGEIGLDDGKKVEARKIIKLERKKADLVPRAPIKLERKGNDIMDKLLSW